MTLTLTLHTQPDVPLEAENLSPAKMNGLDSKQIAGLQLLHGNQRVAIGDFFRAAGSPGDEMRLVGDLSRVKLVGSDMSRGHLYIDGNTGAHLGTRMSGGRITVTGDSGDWVGPDMSGGRIVIQGNAGHMVGSAYRGSAVGIRGGEILIHGRAGNEIGNGMRRGLIAVGGNSGDFAGVNMLAGSIFIFGEPGIRAGASMRRGTICCFTETQTLPTFSYAACYAPLYLRPYLLHLRQLGLPVEDAHIGGRFHRYVGDCVELNRGEIMVYAA